MHDFPTLKDQSLSDRIYEELKSRLMLGAYLPGEKLSMRKLALEFGTSPMPVREALKRLASERAIESEAAKAYNVPKLSDKRAADLFVLRGLLEVAAVEAAFPALTPDIITELSGLRDRMGAHLKLHDFPAYMTDNYRFHFPDLWAGRQSGYGFRNPAALDANRTFAAQRASAIQLTC